MTFPQFFSTLSFQQRLLLAVFILLKLALIVMLPLTGDEAYFIVWGQNLSLGYYDHPPAVGWVLGVMGSVADHLLWYRSFAFFAAILISYLIYRLIRIHQLNTHSTHSAEAQDTLAWWVALAFFVYPI